MADNQQNRTPNRDKWFQRHAHRGAGVPESKNRRQAVEVSEPDAGPTSWTGPTPTTTTSASPRPTPPSDRS